MSRFDQFCYYICMHKVLSLKTLAVHITQCSRPCYRHSSILCAHSKKKIKSTFFCKKVLAFVQQIDF